MTGVAKVHGDGIAKMRGDGVAEVRCDPSGDPLAYVFKTQTDEYVGQVALVKILSGTVHADDVLVNQRTGAKERLHNLLRVLGSKHTAIDTAEAGDIVGAIKLTDVSTGDTLAPIGSSLTVPPIVHRRPVYGIAVAAESAGDEDKLATALAELVSDDPTLEVTRDSENPPDGGPGRGRRARAGGADPVEAAVRHHPPDRTGQDRLPRDAARHRGDGGPPQEAERRPRPVRGGDGPLRAAPPATRATSSSTRPAVE